MNTQSCADLNVFDELKLFIYQYASTIDVSILCETWFNPNMCDCELYGIDGYNSYHSCREIRIGGGISVYVLNSHTVCNVEKSYINLSITNIDKLNEINIIGLYRVPNYNNINRFFDTIERLLSKYTKQKCFFVGDINIDIQINKTNAIKTKYLNMLSSQNFVVCNTDSTRDVSGSIVDHTATNTTLDFNLSVDTISVPFSDHNIVLTKLNCSKSDRSQTKTCKSIDYEKLTENLQKVFNDNPLNTNCVNELYHYISQNTLSELQRATKTKTIKLSKVKQCEWMLSCPNIQFLMKKKANLINKRKKKEN